LAINACGARRKFRVLEMQRWWGNPDKSLCTLLLLMHLTVFNREALLLGRPTRSSETVVGCKWLSCSKLLIRAICPGIALPPPRCTFEQGRCRNARAILRSGSLSSSFLSLRFTRISKLITRTALSFCVPAEVRFRTNWRSGRSLARAGQNPAARLSIGDLRQYQYPTGFGVNGMQQTTASGHDFVPRWTS